MAKTTKTKKAKVPANKNGKTKRVSMEEVISFRLTKPQYEALSTIFEKQGIMGVTSVRQFSRKLVVDYMAGKLKYANAADLLADTESFKG